MTNLQFSFSFTVGVLVSLLGVFVLTKAAVGAGLILLGACIVALSLLTRGTLNRSAQALVAPANVPGLKGSAADY